MLTVPTPGNPGAATPAKGAVAAAFTHATNAACEPHLHTHALLANLGQSADGRWFAVSGSRWKVSRRTLEALYQLELRHQIALSGHDVEWRMRRDGFAEAAGVPRSAVRAGSTQSRATSAKGWFAARKDATPAPWRRSLAVQGFDPDRPGIGQRGGSRAPATPLRADPGPPMVYEVTQWLASRQSSFAVGDVIVALASRYQPGMPAEAAHAWAEAFCRSPRALVCADSPRRWTSDLARQGDESLRRLLAGAAIGRGEGISNGSPGRMSVRTAAEHLVEDAERVSVLGCEAGRSELIVHAEIVEACKSEWARAGFDVMVDSPTASGAKRWHALAGLAPYRGGARDAVVVVDQAGRRATPDLLALVSQGLERGNRFVMIEGGTFPHLTRPLSNGLVEFAGGGRVTAETPPWGPVPGDRHDHDRVVDRATGGLEAPFCLGQREEVRTPRRSGRSRPGGSRRPQPRREAHPRGRRRAGGPGRDRSPA